MARDDILSVRNAFVLEGELYFKARIIQQENIVICYSASTGRKTSFVWTLIKHKKESVWRARQVANMMGRQPPSIREPYSSGKLDYKWVIWREDVPTLPKQIFWDREDIFKLHDYLREKAKNKDGSLRKARGLPSRVELANLLNTGVITYIKNKNGKYVPSYAAPDLKY